MLDVPDYLNRIVHTGPLAPTPDTLRQLQRAHLFHVPFENLDIALGRRILCDENAFLAKIVNRRRGGFCYEMNGAFSALLRELGFRVTLLSARVPREDGSAGPEFDHLTLRVDLDEPWLVDVGFGDSFLDPLRLALNQPQTQNGLTYRLIDHNQTLHVERLENDAWKPQYNFTLQPRALQDFAPMCHYHQTSPDSPFTRKKLCTMATHDGRITLSEQRLIFTRNGKKEEQLLTTEEEWRSALKQYFHITL
jgi:N-hydroxyarylamine O-acetyltransferase